MCPGGDAGGAVGIHGRLLPEGTPEQRSLQRFGMGSKWMEGAKSFGRRFCRSNALRRPDSRRTRLKLVRCEKLYLLKGELDINIITILQVQFDSDAVHVGAKLE